MSTTLIQGGTVVAFHEGAHRLLRDGQVLCEDGEVAFVGRGYQGRLTSSWMQRTAW